MFNASQNRGNYISDRSSTKVHHAPGGKSSFSLGWSDNNESSTLTSRKKNVPQTANTMAYEPQACGVHNNNNSQPKKSMAEDVLQFTTETGTHCPNAPELMQDNEVEFITKMIIDELLELLATRFDPEEAKALMHTLVSKAKTVPRVESNNPYEVIGEQADALVDIWYYSLNAACKKGMNLSKVFDRVHQANMAKKDPRTGTFLRREDGKIIKPTGWVAPNITEEMEIQAEQGSWS